MMMKMLLMILVLLKLRNGFLDESWMDKILDWATLDIIATCNDP